MVEKELLEAMAGGAVVDNGTMEMVRQLKSCTRCYITPEVVAAQIAAGESEIAIVTKEMELARAWCASNKRPETRKPRKRRRKRKNKREACLLKSSIAPG